MSIQSEVNRISQAKEDIINAIEAKGVSVPENTSISNLAQYISGISSQTEYLYSATFSPEDFTHTSGAGAYAYRADINPVQIFSDSMEISATGDWRITSPFMLYLDMTNFDGIDETVKEFKKLSGPNAMVAVYSGGVRSLFCKERITKEITVFFRVLLDVDHFTSFAKDISGLPFTLDGSIGTADDFVTQNLNGASSSNDPADE